MAPVTSEMSEITCLSLGGVSGAALTWWCHHGGFPTWLHGWLYITHAVIPHPVTSARRNACGSSYKVPVIVLQFQPSTNFSETLHENPFNGFRVVRTTCGQTDRQDFLQHIVANARKTHSAVFKNARCPWTEIWIRNILSKRFDFILPCTTGYWTPSFINGAVYLGINMAVVKCDGKWGRVIMF